MNRKPIIGVALGVAAISATRRFGPALHQRAMDKCHEMLNRMAQGRTTGPATGIDADVTTHSPCDPASCRPGAPDESETEAASV